MQVLVYVPMHMHIYVNTCEIPKLTLGVFFSFSPLYLLRQGLLLGPELLSFSQVVCLGSSASASRMLT